MGGGGGGGGGAGGGSCSEGKAAGVVAGAKTAGVAEAGDAEAGGVNVKGASDWALNGDAGVGAGGASMSDGSDRQYCWTLLLEMPYLSLRRRKDAPVATCSRQAAKTDGKLRL